MPLPVPFGRTLLRARYDVQVEPLASVDEIEHVAARTVMLWEQEGPFERPRYVGEAAQKLGSYRVSWTEGVRRPLRREVLWRVGRVGDALVWGSIDGLGWGRTPHWLKEALTGVLVDLNAGLRERDLGCLPPASDRRQAWRCMRGVGAARSLRLDDFNPDAGAEDDDVVHLRDLPELLWLAAGWPGDEPGEWNQGFLRLSRGVFEVLEATEHWLYRALPARLDSREQIVQAVAAAPTRREAGTLRDLRRWRERLMEPARPWAGVLMCQHPVLRGRGGKHWDGWSGAGGEDVEVAGKLARLGDEIAMRALDGIDTARRLGDVMVDLWGLGADVDEPVLVSEARRGRRSR